jgi:HEAT repeat protein
MELGSAGRWKIATGLCAAYGLALSLVALRPSPEPPLSTDEPKNRAAAQTRLRLFARADVSREAELFDALHRATRPQQIAVLIEQLGHVGSADAVPELVKFLSDRRYPVRDTALLALGRIGSATAVDHLIAEVDKRPAHAGNEAEALVLTGDTRAIDRLIELALEPRNPLRRSAIIALGKLGSRDVREILQSLIDDPESGVREAVFHALNVIGGEETTNFLIKVARSNDPKLRPLALAALSDSDRPDVLAVLVEAAGGLQPTAADAALVALAEIPGPAAFAALRKLAQSAPTPQRRSQIVYILGGRNDPGIDDLMVEFLRHRDVDVRLAALQQLERSGHPDTLGHLLELAERGSQRERETALALLSNSPEPIAKDTLLALARTGGPNGQSAFSALLSSYGGDPDIIDLALERWKNGGSDEAGQALYALSQSDDPRAREALVEAAQSEDERRALMALNTLSSSDADPEALSALLPLVTGERPRDVRARALDTLLAHDRAEGFELAARLVNGDDAALAQSVVQSLSNSQNPRALGILEVASTAKDVDLRAQVASALGNRGPEGLALLRTLSGDADETVARTAALALATVGTEESVDTLVTLTEDPTRKAFALQALGNIQHPKAEAVLYDALSQGDEKTLPDAILASSYVGSERLNIALRQFLYSENREIARAAAVALDQRGLLLSTAERDRLHHVLREETIDDVTFTHTLLGD